MLLLNLKTLNKNDEKMTKTHLGAFRLNHSNKASGGVLL